ncbi:Ig domain-containing protein, partial [Flavobacterium sp. XN-5]|nr:Ig domain-containing protein [Flavobacterium sp. XN-5]
MKNKLLLFLLFFSFFGSKVEAKNFEHIINNYKQNLQLKASGSLNDTVKKKSFASKTVGTKAIIPPPLTTAGSACKDASQATVQVFLNASGGSGDVLEWYGSQSSSSILHTGSIYAPLIGSTTTYYVRTRSGTDFSVRVPVVASVYVNPPTVILSMSTSGNAICQGEPIVFTATGGGNFYEFLVDGSIKQAMSTSNTFSTSDLTDGQTVKVRSRYGVIYDGVITETAWGTGALEDNLMSAALSPNAVDGYINSVKMSSSEDQLVFGISGKLGGDKSMLLFLDTKPGGFNIANYGDEPITAQLVKGFNYFNNNNPYNNFDSYFFPDYCLAIQSSDGGTTYFADVIELKSGTSTKVNLGSASTGSPSASMGVNSGNSGINDYNLGFEVGVLKALLGYTVGDIKFFALTMQENIVTNSFLSPELIKIVDYGTGFVDYNSESPNAVVVSGDALKHCYIEDSKTINIAPLPTISGNSTVCFGLTTSLTGSGTPNTTNPWTSATPSVATISSSGVVTGVSAGTSLIRYTDINGCTITQTITVNPLPTITGTLTVCVGSTITLTGSVTPNATNPWVSASPSVATVNSSGVVTGVSAGTSVITYTNSNGCTVTQTVTVNSLPTITGTLNVCIGLTTTLTGSATPNATNPWVSASPSIATINSTGVVTGVSVGTSLITYTNSNGCEITQTFTVNPLPTITGALTVCVGLTTTLTGSATANDANPWVSASPSVATVNSSGVVTGVAAGTSVITYTNSNGCTVTQAINVNPLPTITGTPSVCIGFSTTLTGSATPNATNPWVSATPSVATVNDSGVVTGVSGGTSVITYTNSNG